MKKFIFIIVAMFLFTSCSSQTAPQAESPQMDYAKSESYSAGGADEIYFNESAAMPADTAPEAAAEMAPEEAVLDSIAGYSENQMLNPSPGTDETAPKRKIIINSNVDMESNDFDNEVEFIKTQVINSGGYIENSNLSTQGYNNSQRYIDMVLKIPAGKYETVKAQILSVGNTLSVQESQQDRTTEYMDTQSKLRLKQEEEKSLLSFLEEAEKIEDIIELEKRLGEARQEIELAQSQINNIDRLSAFSTMSIQITEVLETTIAKIEPDSFGSQIKGAFISSLNTTINFFEAAAIFISGAFLPLLALGLFVLMILNFLKVFKPKGE
ncbi:MAG: DUF4349 domain-containing protein [Clostridiales bacterium]|jgi:hypothetical protein|nr:DUF4349 domain-containing protein [Clostridiales bacterium]